MIVRDIPGHPNCPGVGNFESTAVSVDFFGTHIHVIQLVLNNDASVHSTDDLEYLWDVLGLLNRNGFTVYSSHWCLFRYRKLQNALNRTQRMLLKVNRLVEITWDIPRHPNCHGVQNFGSIAVTLDFTLQRVTFANQLQSTILSRAQ